MPDAHVGYGLPIGGVLATHDAVIPYAVGVDIACRMKMTVLDLPTRTLDDGQDRLDYSKRGKGSAASLNSASHGAGRRMSRTKAKEMFTWDMAQQFLRARGVTLLSAGLDEVPMAYKDIDEVMAAQQDLVEPLARFEPRLVKMAPSGEPPED